jgi:serine/threonine protein kinase
MLVGKQFGPFTVEGELGSGAMGTVYFARMERKGQQLPVALKMVSMALVGDEKAMARFEREANILKQLKHPNIVRLYGTGKYGRTPFIVMEYVEGESLDHVLTRRGRLSWEEAFALCKALCAALQHAHDKGIIHRDLKPANLLVAKGDLLKLTDFGIAKDTDVTALTGANSTLGTASYMSPEQCRGERNLTPRSDLYSLGVVLFELITGRKPFYADNSMDMFLKHVNEPPLRPSRYTPDLPVWVDNLIMFLLEKKPESRPADAQTVARMMEDIETKVIDQRSAGVEAASARRVDRKLSDAEATDDDREAALALKGQSKKKSRKKELAKKAERKKLLLTVVGIAAIVLVLGGLAFWQLRPDSLPKAYAKVEATAPDEKLDAVADFLKSHAGKTGPEMDKANALFRERLIAEGDKQLTNRHGSKMLKPQEGEDKDAIENVWLGMDAEALGNLPRAVTAWKVVAEKGPAPEASKYSNKPDACRVGLKWIAEKRIADIEGAGPKFNELVTLADNAKFQERLPEFPKNGPDDTAFRAAWAERFGDPAKARKYWDLLASQSEKSPESHKWWVLANAQRGRLQNSQDAPAQRIARGESALQAADALWEMTDDTQGRKSKLAARAAWFEIATLYDDETEPALKAVCAAAKQRLQSRPKPE